MKKTKLALALLSAAFVTVSCQSDIEDIQSSSKPMVINAVAEGIESTGTRAEMAYKYDILWSANDKIYVTDGTSNDTFTLQDGAGTTEGSFKQDNSATFNGEVKAYYPSTLVQGGTLTWPATQTVNPVVPMYSKKTLSGSTSEDFKLTSMGAILQIVFNTTRDDVTLKSVKIEDGVQTMSGAFSVDSDGKAIISATDKAGITLDLGAGKALGKGANYLNIAVPAGTYSNLKLTFTAIDGGVCVMESSTPLTINQNTVGKLTLTGNAFKYDDSNLLPGLFSVSPTKKVQFTKSNLYWNGSAFKFEANQTDYQTTWNINHVSHFYWTKTAAASYAQNYGETSTRTFRDRFFADGKDVEHLLTVEGTSNLYVLSSSEWDYLRNDRANAISKVKYPVTVGGKANCIIFAPDNFSGTLSTSYTLQQVNENGFVCLPPAGAFSNSHSFISSTSGNGYVWSSTISNVEHAFVLQFIYNNAERNGQIVNDGGRNAGASIRLVKTVSQ